MAKFVALLEICYSNLDLSCSGSHQISPIQLPALPEIFFTNNSREEIEIMVNLLH